MNCKYSGVEKQNLIDRYLFGESVMAVITENNIPRSTFYSWVKKHNDEKNAKKSIDISLNNFRVLNNKVERLNGERVSEKMVVELMRDMGLASIRQNAKSLYLNRKKKKTHPNLLNQKFTTNAPNQVWVSDITHFKYGEKWYYICTIIDLFSRKVIGYKVSLKNSTYLTKSTFKQAYENRKPQGKLIFHSDREGVYGSAAFRDYMESLEVEQSFSKARVPYDNSVSESFFALMKREELYRTNYRSENEFRKAVDDYIIFYNSKRPHASCQYKTPEQWETVFFDKHSDSGK